MDEIEKLRAAGFTEAEIADYLKEQGGGIDYAKGLGRAVGKGALFGFNDELEAGLRTLGGLAGDYRATRDEIRQAEDQFRADNPKAAMAAELAGGFVPVVGIASKVGTAARLFPRATGRLAAIAAKYASAAPTNVLANVARGSLAGAGYGAVAGAGNAREMENVPGGALIGGGVGAATGAVLTPVLGAVANRVSQRLAGIGREDKVTAAANRVLTRSVEDAGGESALRAQMAADRGLRGDMVNLADANDATRALADAAVSTSPAARASFVPGLRTRAEGEAGRLEQDFLRATGTTGDDAALQADRLARARAAEFSGPMGKFEQLANKTNVGGRVVAMDPKTPIATGRGFWKNWKEFGDTYQEAFRSAGIPVPGRNPTFHELQGLHQRLRGKMSEARVAGDSYKVDKLKPVIEDLRAVMEHNVPEFKALNAEYALAKSREEALQLGVQAVRSGSAINPAEVGRAFNAMNLSDKNLFREGIAAQVLQQVGGKKLTADVARQMFHGLGAAGKTDNASRVMKIAFKDPKELQAFVERVALEERMNATSKIGQNSLTAQRSSLQEEFGGKEGILFKTLRALGYTGPKGAAFTGIATLAGQGNPALRREVSERVANGLLDPRLADQVLRRAGQGKMQENLMNFWQRELNPQVQGLLGMMAGGQVTR